MSKIRKSAQGQACMVRIPGICNSNPETTVLAHLNGAGMGRKSSDMAAAYACSACHDAVDGRVWSEYSQQELSLMFYEGILRTQEILRSKGLIKINGEK